LRFFAKAIGEANRIYTDERAAQEAGFRSLPAPLTFTFCLENDVPDPFAFLESLGVDVRRLLHGEQSFKYFAPVYAGDSLTFETRVSDIYDKKAGTLEFIVLDTDVRNQTGVLVAEQRSALVLRSA